MQGNLAGPVCVFRVRITWSPRHRNQCRGSTPAPVFKPTSKTRAVQPPSSCLSPITSSWSIPAPERLKLGSYIPPWGLWPDLGVRRQDTQFFSQYHWDKNTSHPGVLSLFSRLSCSPGFLEIAGKPVIPPAPAIAAHAPFACLRRRLQLLGGDGGNAG